MQFFMPQYDPSGSENLLEKILSFGRIPLDNILEIYLSLGIKEETIVENKFY